MRSTLIGLCLLALVPMTAQAQTGKHVALGASIGLREFTDDHFSRKNPTVSVLYRISQHPNQHRQGWGWHLGGNFGYSNADFDTDLGTAETRIGTLKMIHPVAGVERAYRHDRVKVGFSVFAGPSFNKFSIDNEARAAYESQLGAPLENIEAKNSLAIRSGVGVWYDLNSWLGLHTGAHYLYNRPKVTTTAGGVSSTTEWRVDRVSLSAGLAVGIF